MRRIAEERERLVVQDWLAGETTTREIASKRKLGATTVRSILARHGVRSLPKASFPRKTSADEDAQIVGRYRERPNAGDIGREFGISAASVLNRVHAAGGSIPPRTAWNAKHLSASQKEEVLRLRAKGLGTRQVGAAIGVDYRRVRKFLLEQGLEVWNKKGRAPEHKGPGGYVWVNVDPNDPLFVMANKRGYVLKHRYVLAQSLGRPLTPSETVHHINAVRDDNRLENLQLRQGRHGRGARFVCLDCGSHNVEAAPLH